MYKTGLLDANLLQDSYFTMRKLHPNIAKIPCI
jgi:hypothetical protein